jgi:hypothetical protein
MLKKILTVTLCSGLLSSVSTLASNLYNADDQKDTSSISKSVGISLTDIVPTPNVFYQDIDSLVTMFISKSVYPDKNSELLSEIVNHIDLNVTTSIDCEDSSQMSLMLAICEKLMGAADLMTDEAKTTIELSLGSLYYHLSDYAKSEKYIKDCFSKLKECNAANYRLIAQVYLYLGNLSRENNKPTEAEFFHRKSLDILKEHGNEPEPLRPRILGYLGALFSEQGDNLKALSIFNEARTVYEQLHPSNYGGLARTFVYLALAQDFCGNKVEAMDFYEAGLKLYKERVPHNRVGRARALGYLGNNYGVVGHLQRAKNALEECTYLYKDCMSDNHVDIAWSLAILGSIRNLRCEHKTAKNCLEEALAIYKQHIPENHVRFGWVEIHYAEACRGLGELDEAKSVLKRVQETYHNTFGAEHFQMTRILRPLGLIALDEGDLTSAEKQLGQALAILEKQNHSFRCRLMEDIADLNFRRSILETENGNLESAAAAKALAITDLQRAFEVVRASYPSDSPHIARIHGRIAAQQK